MNKENTPLLSECDQIQKEQVKLLFSSSPLSLFATIVSGSLLVNIHWNVVDNHSLLLWLGVLFAVTFYRAGLAWLFAKKSDQLFNSQQWERYFNLGILMTALTWGGSSIFIFPELMAYQAFHAFILAGMCAGAVSTLAFRKTPILLFLYITLIPTTYQLFSVEGSIGISVGLMSVMFLMIVSKNGLKIYNDTEENIRLRIRSVKREKTLKESEERFRMIFESAPLGILHYSKDSRVESYNPALADMLKIDIKEAQGKQLSMTSDPGLMLLLNAALEGEEIKHIGCINELYPSNDAEVRMYMRGVASLKGEIVGGVVIVEDISKDMQLERAKDDFIATVSHELRTPLTAIIGSLGLLMSGVLDSSPEKGKALLDNAYRNSERLLRLINDILDMEKINAGKMEYAMNNLALHTLLEQAIQSSQGYGSHLSVEFILLPCEKDWMVCVDADRMQQVMSNLLSNAAKFSKEGGVVTISAERHEQMVRISVSDKGVGMAEEFHEKIFERFSQSEGGNIRRTGGTGLGLNIVKMIIEQHSGTIGFHSVLGEGTTFYFDLPLVYK